MYSCRPCFVSEKATFEFWAVSLRLMSMLVPSLHWDSLMCVSYGRDCQSVPQYWNMAFDSKDGRLEGHHSSWLMCFFLPALVGTSTCTCEWRRFIGSGSNYCPYIQCYSCHPTRTRYSAYVETRVTGHSIFWSNIKNLRLRVACQVWDSSLGLPPGSVHVCEGVGTLICCSSLVPRLWFLIWPLTQHK